MKNLYDVENVKIFVSSSSTSIHRDTRAFLTGRTRVLEILPLDFDEFLLFRNLRVKKSEGYLIEKYFEMYMQMGGIPEYVLTGDVSYLDNLIEGVLLKDIVALYGVRDITTLKDFFRLLMERSGKKLSISRAAKIMRISPDSVKRFFEYFNQTFLIYSIERCGKLSERVRSPKKVYAADVGIRNHTIGYRDKGAIFENLVFLKIKGKNPCYIYRDGIEIDFQLGDTLLEVKLNEDLSEKQRKLFDLIEARNKGVIRNIQDFLNLTI